MATLVLSVVGSIFGGPVGAAIGAAIGQQVDGRLFAPKGRKGPRLNELAVQSSTYGAPIPRLYGRTRVAGSVIWATDLVEDRRKVSTGKGRPKQTTYSYSANFAVALSARQISRVGRIWADGKLLRGETGDFKTQTAFRLHLGTESQSVDPFIASAEGIGNAPAYCGIAYAMFEGFQLADYGNRIPSLSFEVIADDTPVTVGTILGDLAPGVVTTASTALQGFAVTGESIRGILESLSDGISLAARDDGVALHIDEMATAGLALGAEDLGAAPNGTRIDRIARERRPLSSLPQRRSLAYYDVDRDYLQGSQSVMRPDLGHRELRAELAASLSSSVARALIERKTDEAVAARDEINVSLPWRYLPLSPATWISIPDMPGEWFVSETQFEDMALRVSLRRLPTATVLPVPATEPGRGLFENDTLHGATVFHLLDLPWLGSGVAVTPAIYVAAAGHQPGWRRAALLLSVDGGQTYDEVGVTAAPAIMGFAATALGVSSSCGFDRINTVEIELLHSGMDLVSTTSDGLIAGRNLAFIGHELIQFEKVEQIAATRVRLSGLLRGRRGTEAAILNHAIGDRFILLETDTLLPLTMPADAVALKAQAIGIGDDVAVESSLTLSRSALMPLAPVHVEARLLANGDMRFSWTRRSRDGWHWVDQVDAPLAEEVELYRVTVTPNAGPSRTTEVQTPQFFYAATERASDVLAMATSVSIAIQQLGTFGPSRPAIFSQSLS